MTAFTTSSGCSWISQWAGVQLDLLVRPGDELGLQIPDLLPREDLEISCAENVENGLHDLGRDIRAREEQARHGPVPVEGCAQRARLRENLDILVDLVVWHRGRRAYSA